MYKLKSSKYKYSVAKPAKKENSITDIKVETPQCFGNHVAAGVKFFASNIGNSNSGKVAVFNCSASGRMGSHPTLSAHGAAVTAIEFSPFYHNMLLTASEDTTVKIWQIPEDGLISESILEPVGILKGFQRRPEALQHHQVAENVLAISCGSEVQIWDLSSQSSIYNKSCDGLVQSMSWSQDGRCIACTTKEKFIKVIDPRESSVIQDGRPHDNHKDTRTVWLGDTGKLATTGFSNRRERELKVWDTRNMKSDLQTLGYGSSTGVLMPFYDPDTKMLFLAGKGDSSMALLEVTDGPQYITEASQVALTDQTKGMALVPKLSVDVMSCEVDRLIQLCAKQIIPIKIEVPRKSHREFASDLFPDTFSDEIVLTAKQWINGEDRMRTKTSLDPSKRKVLGNIKNDSLKLSSTIEPASSEIEHNSEQKYAADDSVYVAPAKSNHSTKSSIESINSKSENAPKINKKKPFAGTRQSKFRHWTASVLHPSTHITNLPQASRQISTSCDCFHANELYAAIPLSTPGGPLAIVELKKVGRSSSDIPSLKNGSVVTDFKWSPFDNREITVALDSGVVRIWNIPDSGLKGTELQPTAALKGHYSKVQCVQYHPLAMDILATAATDMKLIIWNLETCEIAIELSGHEDEILHMAWSRNGKYLATVSKDGKIRIFEPRESIYPISSGPGHEGSRGARVVWVFNDELLLLIGFTKQGVRVISVHEVGESEIFPLQTFEHDGSPSTLIPYYDPDTNIVLLTGKGESIMISFEIFRSEPYLFPLSTFTSDQPHQGFSFLSKMGCDVQNVEFARAWRLSKNSLEPVSFKVPRIKMEYFQDDIFPETRDLAQPTMNADQWLAGANVEPPRVSLKPPKIKALSDAPKEAPKEKKYESYNADTYKTDEEKKEELLAAMSNKLDLSKQLEQDLMEGVDEDEWDD